LWKKLIIIFLFLLFFKFPLNSYPDIGTTPKLQKKSIIAISDTLFIKMEKKAYLKIYLINNYDFEISNIKLIFNHPRFRAKIEPALLKAIASGRQKSFMITLFYKDKPSMNKEYNIIPIFKIPKNNFRKIKKIRLIMIDEQTESQQIFYSQKIDDKYIYLPLGKIKIKVKKFNLAEKYNFSIIAVILIMIILFLRTIKRR
jgi:hypothetical protein